MELLLAGVDLRKAIIGEPGNRSDILFWIDTWLGFEPLCNRFPVLFNIESMKGCRVADRVKMQGEVIFMEFEWSTELLTEENNEVMVLSNLIHTMNFTQGPDRWHIFCEEHYESVEHIFVSCRDAQIIWDYISNWCKIGPLLEMEKANSFGIRNNFMVYLDAA
ncbi:hypothetical protein E3N88_34067 [Mikania micrantha]|uniref:Reverse transcriptase zinc-binding domain-containing protein n=1 Tax=Mikania micrantha TaxID=192012 RepID=A0A5N6MDQ6_9ASTR|nr:hypothetical protein E3N88_34067 [Mikania micrantha]